MLSIVERLLCGSNESAVDPSIRVDCIQPAEFADTQGNDIADRILVPGIGDYGGRCAVISAN